MDILSQFEPRAKKVVINRVEWEFPYDVYNLVELPETIIVHFHSSAFRKLPPPDLYVGCNIWCYEKKTKEIRWIVEEPPIAHTKDGKIWNRGLGPYDKYFKKRFDRDECYLNLWYHEYNDTIKADTTGARRFIVDPNTGKVTLVEGLHPKLF